VAWRSQQQIHARAQLIRWRVWTSCVSRRPCSRPTKARIKGINKKADDRTSKKAWLTAERDRSFALSPPPPPCIEALIWHLPLSSGPMESVDPCSGSCPISVLSLFGLGCRSLRRIESGQSRPLWAHAAYACCLRHAAPNETWPEHKGKPGAHHPPRQFPTCARSQSVLFVPHSQPPIHSPSHLRWLTH